MRQGIHLLLLMLTAVTGCGAMHHATDATTPSVAPISRIADAASPVMPLVATPAVAIPTDTTTTVTAPRLGCGDHQIVAAGQRRHDEKRRFSLTALLARGERMLPELKRIMEAAGAPRALALVAAIESGFRADARGRRGERGLWQLKPARARQLGLVVTAARDDRMNPELATRAAARHLLALRDQYEDWALALAAYSAGDGRIDAALRAGRGATFWELADQGRLPRAARNFVLDVFALVRVAAPEEC